MLDKEQRIGEALQTLFELDFDKSVLERLFAEQRQARQERLSARVRGAKQLQADLHELGVNNTSLIDSLICGILLDLTEAMKMRQ